MLTALPDPEPADSRKKRALIFQDLMVGTSPRHLPQAVLISVVIHSLLLTLLLTLPITRFTTVTHTDSNRDYQHGTSVQAAGSLTSPKQEAAAPGDERSAPIVLRSRSLTHTGGQSAIYGILYSPGLKPRQGANIVAVNRRSGQRRSVATDARGQFLLNHLAPGQYILEISAPGSPTPEFHRLDLPAGRLEEIHLVLLPKGESQRLPVPSAPAQPVSPVRDYRPKATQPSTIPSFFRNLPRLTVHSTLMTITYILTYIHGWIVRILRVAGIYLRGG